jgi:hypothetical protein
MNFEKRIGKISEISVGLGGYQGVMLGLSVKLESTKGSWCVNDFKGFWGPDIERTESTKWTESDRLNGYSDTMALIGKLLKEAGKTTVAELRGTPVEVEFNGNMLSSWRILTEAI